MASRLTDDPAFREHAIGVLEAVLAWLRSPAPVVQPEKPERAEVDPDVLLDAKEVGEILGIPTKSVYELGGLERVRVGERRVRWRLADVQEFIKRRRERC